MAIGLGLAQWLYYIMDHTRASHSPAPTSLIVVLNDQWRGDRGGTQVQVQVQVQASRPGRERAV